jgi:hypothetical protein
MDDLHKYGLVSAKVNAAEHTDTSIVREAMGRIQTN